MSKITTASELTLIGAISTVAKVAGVTGAHVVGGTVGVLKGSVAGMLSAEEGSYVKSCLETTVMGTYSDTQENVFQYTKGFIDTTVSAMKVDSKTEKSRAESEIDTSM